MKKYSILYFDEDAQTPIFNDEIAFIRASSPIEALRIWWHHINTQYYITSKTLTFTYTAFMDEKNNILI